ncbi:phage holin [Listeria fleischmannii]|uniref:Phage phi LC3 family holin n=1 Tax=Listeria fleischmannii FSL S10-1203 TaxID=1265822 RepID=W7DFC4_9LIST|nr:phage holin [Listeria fleischmannii]EUJ44023.1 phage phi LC3 family holin [Listeria fleischmannii FSL S10-1203]
MKINWKIRLKSGTTWFVAAIPILTIIWSTGGFQASDLDSWQALGNSFMTFIKSPASIVAVLSALFATYIDPTTKGLSDSSQALNYEKQRLDTEKLDQKNQARKVK